MLVMSNCFRTVNFYEMWFIIFIHLLLAVTLAVCFVELRRKKFSMELIGG